MESNYFTTSDMGLSSYLKSKNIPFKEVRLQDPSDPRNICEFIFSIEKSDPRIHEILEEWNHGDKCVEIKRILYMYRGMKKIIMDFLSKERPRKFHSKSEQKRVEIQESAKAPDPKAVDDALDKILKDE